MRSTMRSAMRSAYAGAMRLRCGPAMLRTDGRTDLRRTSLTLAMNLAVSQRARRAERISIEGVKR
ncbi:hypothetical protein BI023_gp48 [Mycobacterium phage Sneeze]|uniref:Uncharacterized protein n=1 Tax=Mycobacterium phage Rabbs TaxID=2530143 RepID=A0A481VSP5_9CAUD|nr:hypothetical protein BI023_gp48 [Mycobacterium phage Sneeze]YP_010051394.1 hypothetical protein KDW71_gp49 [Mycobacterium phage Rabbs]ANU79778.1 hypothetical protein SEA_SNEEZE_48 [Mycobacterium phage Sneeze]QBI96800.1 hypothetical protein SEA_RABBS_49 [Mycobacterium phage Rabbs]